MPDTPAPARSPYAGHLGIQTIETGTGTCHLALVNQEEFQQESGFTHVGILSALADQAATDACHTLTGTGKQVLTIECKLNFLRPATGRNLACKARIIRGGKQIMVVETHIWSQDANHGERAAHESLVCQGTSTMAIVQPRQRPA
ncbi:MAG: PaaI family thioesterase [Deltaproteobacteria bacterium]|nr:PaaI family thioesterase [Candidatus Anaeroferrophillacea bacterium]